MAPPIAASEVGLFSVLQLDSFHDLGYSHSIDVSKQALVLMNDAADCEYVINGEQSRPIVPKTGEQHMVLIACESAHDATRRSRAYPRQLFCFSSGSFTWPGIMYRTPGAQGLTGPFETALVIMTDKLQWTSKSVSGRLVSEFNLPDPCKLYKVIAGTPDDVENEVTEFGTVTRIDVKFTGMAQGQCLPSGWPP